MFNPIWIVLILLAVLLWQNARKAAELATRTANNTCERQGLQLLDGTVSLQRISLRRIGSGRIALQRHYRFDYSEDGASRRYGFIIVTGGRIESVGLAPHA